MESIIIGPDRIKIMLSGKDLRSYGITPEEDMDSSLNGTVLRSILRDAGFDTALSRLHVQIYTSKDGGCEMYVTVLPAEYVKDGGEGAALLVLKDVRDVKALLTRLSVNGYSDTVSVYRAESSFFLLFDRGIPDFAGDYGSVTGTEKIPYILEYSSPVCVNTEVSGADNYF